MSDSLAKAYYITKKGGMIPYLFDQEGANPPEIEVEFLAQEDIAFADVVTSRGYRADTADYQTRNIIIGFAKESVATGFTGKAVSVGQIKNASWSWIPGDKIFLNGLGTIATLPPAITYVQMLGTATKSDTINVDIKQATLL